MLRRVSLIREADEHVPVTVALTMIGVDVPGDVGLRRSTKVRCPFGDLYHKDLGMDAAMRIYPDSNHAFCFAGCGAFTPVALVAHAFDWTRRHAARELLERFGYHPADPVDVWSDPPDPAPDPVLLAEALKTFCLRVDPHWTTHQFAPPVATALRRCFDLLDVVATPLEASTWLTACKTVMVRAIGVQDSRSPLSTERVP